MFYINPFIFYINPRESRCFSNTCPACPNFPYKTAPLAEIINEGLDRGGGMERGRWSGNQLSLAFRLAVSCFKWKNMGMDNLTLKVYG